MYCLEATVAESRIRGIAVVGERISLLQRTEIRESLTRVGERRGYVTRLRV